MSALSALILCRGKTFALLGLFLTGLWVTSSSQAQTANDYIVQVPEWQALEDDAVRTLTALGHSDPYLTSRNEIRAYVFAQLFELMKSGTSNSAKDALIEKIREFRAMAFHNALSSHDWYANNGCWSDTDALGCLIGDFFGEAPNYAEFTHSGIMEAFGDMADDEKALQIKLEVVRALDWYAAHADLPDEQIYVYGTLPPNDGYDAFRQFSSGLGGLAASQLFGDLVAMAIEAAVLKALPGLAVNSGAATYAATGVTIVAGVIVAAYTTYHIADRVVLYNTIKDRAENPDAEPLEIDKLTTTPAGITELFEVVVAQTVGPMSITNHTCRLQSGANQRSDCQAYTLVDDPDYVDERYTSAEHPHGLPLPSASTQTNFWRGQEGADLLAMQISSDLTNSTALSSSYTDTGFVPWVTIKRTEYELPEAPETIINESGAWSFRTRSAIVEAKAYTAENNALVSYQIGTYPSQTDTSWKYTHALNYTNWRDEWWTAWLVGGKFLHKKQATKMPGRVVVTDYNGGNRCFQNPPASGPFTGAWASQGPKCLLGHNTDFSQLKPGDKIFVGGLTRIVSGVVNCTKEFDLLGLWQPCDHSQITDNKAVVVTQAFPEEMYGYTFLGDIVFNRRWDFDYARWYTPAEGAYDDCSEPLLATTQESLLNGPPGDRDCYISPLIQYSQYNGFGDTPEKWSALIASPFVVLDDRSYLAERGGPSHFLPYKTYEDGALDINLPKQGLFANDRVPTVDHPSGIFPWSDSAATEVTLLTPEWELHGEVVINADGTFTYTPQAELNDWESRDWLQQFQYELCDIARADRCATATVTVRIDNNPARAIEPQFEVIAPSDSGGDYTLQFKGYTYQDDENDPEDTGKTEICWLGTKPLIVLTKVCWFGDEQPVALDVPISDYLNADSDWYLVITPHATRGIPLHGKEPGNFAGPTLLTRLPRPQGASVGFETVRNLSLQCRPGGEAYPSVSTDNAWVKCTFEMSPFVEASIYFESRLARQPWSGDFFNALLPNWYHESHEKTFSQQFCVLEHDLETGSGRCSVYWLSEPVPWEFFPPLHTGTAVRTSVNGTVIDANGAVVFGTLGGQQASSFIYRKWDTVTRDRKSDAGIFQSPDLIVDVKHNESTLVTLPASADSSFSDFVIINPPLLGSADNQHDGTILYSPDISACCTTDSFTYQVCDASDSSFCSLPGTVTLNIIDGQAPTIEASYQPEANAAGWHNVAVAVTFICADELSGIAFCSGEQTVYDQGEYLSITGLARDLAGNSAQTSIILSIDRVAPAVSYSIAQESPSTYRIDFICETDLSGLIDGCPENLPIGAAALNAGVSISVSDFADNVTTLTIQRDVEVDVDGDGVPDEQDNCPATPVGSVVNPKTGCSVEDLCTCEGPPNGGWKNHGKYVSCVGREAEALVAGGFMTIAAKDTLVSQAGRSSCGKKH